MSRQVDLKHIAAQAGVSTTTAHAALYDRGRVNAATRERVKAIAQQLGYRPNSLARALRMRRSNLIGVVITSMFSHLYERTLPQIERVALAKDHHVFYASSHGDPVRERAVIELLRGSGMEGLLLFPASSTENLAFYQAIGQDLPMVMIEPPDHLRGFDTVSTDNVAAGRTAARTLLGSGRRRLGFSTSNQGPSEDWWMRDRLNGCAEATREAGVPLAVIAPSDATPATLERFGSLTLDALLASPQAVDGIVAANDDTAYRMISGLRRHGRRMPDDVAVVGFDDQPSSASFSPSLSSFRQPMERIGELAATLLLRRMGGDRSTPEQHLIPAELIERESTAAAIAS